MGTYAFQKVGTSNDKVFVVKDVVASCRTNFYRYDLNINDNQGHYFLLTLPIGSIFHHISIGAPITLYGNWVYVTISGTAIPANCYVNITLFGWWEDR